MHIIHWSKWVHAGTLLSGGWLKTLLMHSIYFSHFIYYLEYRNILVKDRFYSQKFRNLYFRTSVHGCTRKMNGLSHVHDVIVNDRCYLEHKEAQYCVVWYCDVQYNSHWHECNSHDDISWARYNSFRNNFLVIQLFTWIFLFYGSRENLKFEMVFNQ